MALIGTGRPNVERLRKREDVEGLRAAVGYQEERVDFDGSVHDTGAAVRSAAIEAISELSGPPVLAAVREALQDEHPDVRSAAVRAAGAAELQETQPDLLRGLATWPDPPYGDALNDALGVVLGWRSEDTPERFADELSRNPEIELSGGQRAMLIGFAAGDPRGEQRCLEAVAEHLVAQLADPELEAAVKDRVASILAWLGSAAAPSLLIALTDGGLDARGVEVAGRIQDNKLLSPLIEQAASPDPEVRAAAAAALGDLLDTGAVVTLVRLTRDDAYVVRQAAIRALDAFGTSAVLVGLAAAIAGEDLGQGPDANGWVRRMLARRA